jgi:Outer membrane protein beta-barrel domain
MFKQGVWVVATLIVLAGTGNAAAQEARAEVGITLGWTFSDGVTGDPFLALDGNIYDQIDPKDAFSWGFNVGYLVNPNVEVGFLFGQQLSALVADGTAKTEAGDMTVTTYHGYVGYNFFPDDAPIRPYAMFGMGATSYGGVDYTAANGRTGEIGGFTNFSTTWGGGVKGYVSPRLGWRGGIQWTPTYIKSDAAGWWCDPYWGCYVIGDAQYSSQWTFNGGVLFRF